MVRRGSSARSDLIGTRAVLAGRQSVEPGGRRGSVGRSSGHGQPRCISGAELGPKTDDLGPGRVWSHVGGRSSKWRSSNLSGGVPKDKRQGTAGCGCGVQTMIGAKQAGS